MERFGQQVLACRGPLLVLFALLTLGAALLASQFRVLTEMDRWQPLHGEYAETLIRFAPVLSGSNRLLVALELRQGEIWSQEFFSAYRQLTQDIASLHGVAPRSVTSL